MEGKARRRRVPAFGEWNYYYYSSELATPPAAPAAAAAPEWCAAAPELEACSDVWFKYSPPPRRPPSPPSSSRRRKVRRPAAEEMDDGGSYGGGGDGKRGLQRHRAATPARTSSSDTVPRTPAGKGKAAAGAARARVVRPVDADLYQVPPPEFLPGDDEPGRRWRQPEAKSKKKASRRRSLWAGCFGFNCVPAE